MKMDSNYITEIENVYKISHTATAGEFISEFHCHDSWEIFVYLEGSVTYYIEDNVYDLLLGDILVIPPGKMHKAVLNTSGEQPYERIVLSLTGQYIDSVINNDCELKEVFDRFRHHNHFLLSIGGEKFKFCQGLLERINRSANSENYKTAMLGALVHTLAEEFNNQPEKDDSHKDELISGIIQYINSHYTEAITLDRICNEFYVSKFYINRKFKDYTGLTIYDYVLTKRIGLACRLIMAGANANEASEKCGFGDYSTFFRTFTAKTGSTPKEYKNTLE